MENRFLPIENVEILLLLNVCHFLGDYSWLSTAWMLSAKSSGKPLFPIFCHAMVHASLMFAVIWFYVSVKTNYFSGVTILEAKLFLLQLISHFIIDVWKGRMNGWFPALSNPANKGHWIIFGFDQFLHQAVIIFMAYLITK